MEDDIKTITNIEAEIYKDGQLGVYVSNDGSSGADYKINSLAEVGEAIQTYVSNYIESIE